MNAKEIALIMGIYLVELTTVLLIARIFFMLRWGNYQKKIIFSGAIFALASAFLVIKEINPNVFHLPNPLVEYSFYGIKTLWWLALGMILSNALHYFVWKGILAKDGETLVHQYLVQFFDGLIYTLCVLLILHQVFGQSILGLLIGSGVLAIIIGLSAQSTLGGVFAGLALHLNNTFRKGDYIVLDKIRGYIVDMNWHSVIIKARDERKIIVPNKLIDESIITNSGEKKLRLFKIKLKVPYEVPPQQAKNMLVEAAQHSRFVLEGTQALVHQFSENAIEYHLEFYTHEHEDIFITNEVLSSVWYAFHRKGISLKPSLLQEQNTHLPVSFEEKSSPEHIFRIFRKVALFEHLSDQEIGKLVQTCKKIVAAPPERITIENQKDYSLFVIEKGTLEVCVKQKDGTQLTVAQLSANQVFGEMALLTGEARKATVRAVSEVVLYEISKENMLEIIKERGEILNDFSRLLAQRQYENQIKSTVYEGKMDNMEEQIEGLNQKIFKLMRQFFER